MAYKFNIALFEEGKVFYARSYLFLVNRQGNLVLQDPCFNHRTRVNYCFWLNIGWFNELGVYQRLCMWCAYIGAQWDPMCLWVIVEKKRRDNDSEDWREGEKTTKGESISDSKIRSEAKGSTQCGDLWVKG